MNLIGGVLADMFALLPFVAVLLLSLFGYLITKRGRTALVDSAMVLGLYLLQRGADRRVGDL